MAEAKPYPLIVLLIIDGWGIAPAGEGNAFSRAKMPALNGLALDYPLTLLSAKTGPARKDRSAYRCELGHMALGGADPDCFLRDACQIGLAASLLSAGVPVRLMAGPDKAGSLGHFFCGQSDLRPLGLEFTVPAGDEFAKTAVRSLDKSAAGLFVLNLSAIDAANITGDIARTAAAIEAVDSLAGTVVKAALKRKATILATSDHGSAEAMIDMKTEAPNRQRTDNPLPFLVVGREYLGKNLGWPDVSSPDLSILKTTGTIMDVAPTIMRLFGLRAPDGWKGKSLI